MWSVGVLLLLLLRNELPFTESDPTFFIEQVRMWEFVVLLFDILHKACVWYL